MKIWFLTTVVLFAFSLCALFGQAQNTPLSGDSNQLRSRLQNSRRNFGMRNLNGGSGSASSQPNGNTGWNSSQPGAEAYASAAQSEDAECDLNFVGADLGMVFKVYSTLVGKTILRDPAIAEKQINLKSEKGQKLSKEEQIEAIEMVLEMNEVHLEPYGKKFIRAVPRANASKEAPKLVDDETLGVSGKVVSMVIRLNYISYEEALKILQEVATTKAKLQGIERNNSILVTDTELNIQRMLMLVKQVDIESKPTEEVKIYQIKNASASDVQQVLQRIVEESQKELGKNANSNNRNTPNFNQPWMRRNAFMRGNQRNAAQTASQPQSPTTSSILSSISDADRGLIRGKVVILSDDRSNKLIIISSAANHKFFKTLIEELDVATTPDTEVRVYRLKYAEAEEVSDMINDLIGNAPSSKNSAKQNQNQNAKSGRTTNVTGGRTAMTASSSTQKSEPGTGELSKENTTVLADKRINGLVVMTRKELVPVVEKIIQSMDIKLSQVLIETVIIEVSLGDNLKTGIDWFHGLKRKDGQFQSGLAGGGGTTSPRSKEELSPTNNIASLAVDALNLTPGGAGINYFIHSDKLNLNAIIKASKTDSRTKYLASPVVMTVDNKEATIEATSSYQFLTGWSAVSSSYSGSGLPSPNYTAKDLGITLKIKPKINPNGTVMLNVEEEYSQLGTKQPMLTPTGSNTGYEETSVDTSVTRKMTSDIILENQQSVILGGLNTKNISTYETGIPLLKDIPFVGKLLFASTERREERAELLIFMTPYVLDDADAAKAEAIRRKGTLSDPKPWDDGGWSASDLSDGVSKKEQLRRLKDEWARQDEERKTRMAIEQEKIRRAKELEKMSEQERKTWLEMHKKEIEEERQKELEKQMLDPDSQSQLKALATEIRERKLKEAEESISESDKAERKLEKDSGEKAK